MTQIIDFHTHTFGEDIAERAINKLSLSANIVSYSRGTDEELARANQNQQMNSVVLPVATKVMQAKGINENNRKKNEISDETGIIYFAAIHPDDTNIKANLMNMKNSGFKGIKLHPVFQGSRIDEDNYLKVIDAASELGLITVIHAGEDISFPGNENASVKYILNMLRILEPQKLVLAHMGGWNQWDLVESDLAGANVYFDTSFCLNRLVPYDEKKQFSKVQMSSQQFIRIINKHGTDKILFGTDSPWTDRKESVDYIKKLGLSNQIMDKLFWANAEKILKA